LFRLGKRQTLHRHDLTLAWLSPLVLLSPM
jgi:hypothetical protein